MKKVSKKILKTLEIIGRIALNVVFYAMIFLTILAVFSTKWVKATYGGLTVDEILFHLTVPIEGTETGILKSFYTKALYPSIWMAIPIIILLFFIFDYFRRYKATYIDFTVFKKKFSIKIHTIVLALLLFSGSIYLMWTNIDKCLTKLKIYDYLEAQKVDNPFIKDNYVETSEVELTFPKKKRNLIYIYLESFESSYFSSSYGGDEYYNLLDGMTDLTAENINFSNTDKFGGALQVAGVGWTSGGLVAQTSGVPVKIDGDTINFEYNHTSFMKGVTSLGDILKDEGYNQEFIIGSDKSFGNRDVYFEGHGDYWLLYQQAKPHLVAHVQLPKTEAEFDNILGWCLGQNNWCDYIAGDFSFICVIAGFNASELTPKYPDFISERIYALYDAVYWWYEYGKKATLINNV